MLPPHQRHDRDDRDRVADHLNHKGGEEIGEGDVAVDALDEFTRGLGLVKREVEFEEVLGKFDPRISLVADRPYMRREVGGGHAQRLISDGEKHESGGERHQFGKVGTLGSAVYECPDQLWIDDLEGNPRQQQG